jgi:hypothetical protein
MQISDRLDCKGKTQAKVFTVQAENMEISPALVWCGTRVKKFCLTKSDETNETQRKVFNADIYAP